MAGCITGRGAELAVWYGMTLTCRIPSDVLLHESNQLSLFGRPAGVGNVPDYFNAA